MEMTRLTSVAGAGAAAGSAAGSAAAAVARVASGATGAAEVSVMEDIARSVDGAWKALMKIIKKTTPYL